MSEVDIKLRQRRQATQPHAPLTSKEALRDLLHDAGE